MGHNKHFLVVRASSPEEAIDNAENAVQYFGNENNWRSFEAAISETGETTDPDWTIEKINKLLNDEVNAIGAYLNHEQAMHWLKILVDTDMNPTNAGTVNMFSLCHYLNEWDEKSTIKNSLNGSNFNVFDHTLYAHQYDETGCTDLIADDEDMEGTANFIVVMDMHS